MKITLNPQQQNALLDMLEFALLSAESDIETNTYEEDGIGYYRPVDFDPEDLAVWLNDAPELSRKLDAMPEIIDQAELIKKRMNALEMAR